jgi:hypothetical protein
VIGVNGGRAFTVDRIGGTPTIWWIDVERRNTWSELRLEMNRYALQGPIDQLAATGRPVGVYSSARDWLKITGGWVPGGVDANWLAGNQPAGRLRRIRLHRRPGEAGAGGGDVAHPSNYDSDIAC